MLKTFIENYKYDFAKEKEVRKRPTFYKDKDGKMQKTTEDKWLDYVEWATVLVALYKQGATSVGFGSDLHPTKKNTLKIFLVIDGVRYETDYPIIDGNSIISDPNQMNIHKAELRGFVKCTAISTGLGLSLWQKEESHLNELLPQEPKKEKQEHEDNTIEFLEWVSELDKCKTASDLGNLYNSNKSIVENTPNIKALFIKKKAEFEAKGKK